MVINIVHFYVILFFIFMFYGMSNGNVYLCWVCRLMVKACSFFLYNVASGNTVDVVELRGSPIVLKKFCFHEM